MIDPLASDDEPDSPDDGAKTMGFLDHLEELRWTLIKSLAVFIAAFVLIAVFIGRARDALNWPLHQGLRGAEEGTFTFMTTSPMAVFSVIIMICFLGAVALSLPFVIFFVAQFVAPALTRRELRLVLPVCIATVVLFVAGGAFSYFLLVPKVVEVSLEYNRFLGTQFLWEADKYYSMLTWMVIGMGAAFQFPLVIQILVILDLVTVQRLRSWRRIMVLGCFIAAAIITPTQDFVTMSIVALPLWVLYEAAVIFAAIYTRRRAAREAAEEAGD